MNIQKDFPLLSQESNVNPLIYFDNAATTQKPQMVLDSIVNFYSEYNANIHRGIYQIAERATSEYEGVRDKVTSFINAQDRQEVIFTKGATESINLVAYSWGRKFLKSNDEILITEMEHHSNNVPWQLVAENTNAKLKYIPINENGELNSPLSYITDKTRLVCLIHQSNVLGTINSIEEIVSKAHSVGAKVLIDGAQSIPHMCIDVQKINCDFFVFSGHKMMAPTGVGVLYGKKEILNEMDPFLSGGEMIKEVYIDSVSFNQLPWKFEAGTSNIAQVIGLGSAIDYIDRIGLDSIHNQTKLLTEYTLDKLSKISGIRIYGNPADRGPVISFNIDGIHSHDLAQLLNQQNICIRVGHHCAQPLLEKFNINTCARVSFYVYNTITEVDSFLKGIKKSVSILQ